ncbi:MAG TPA: serine/threonine-protein kinase [Polyangiaceae bacterium]|nr:serine/threonine-protein kinase [Polyangiaceae bacterium]
MEMSEPTLPMGVERATKRYRPILEIGSGGMSRVYLAVASGPGGMQKFHVIKRLLPALAEDPEFLNMFLEEARLSARLNHPNVVQINEVGFDGEHYFMAMEYLEGQSLETVVRWAARRGGLPFGLYARVLVDAAQGLHYAHELCDYDGRPLGVVHRDISPHNIFVTDQGQFKVLDFGIAKAADSAQQTRTGMLKGKVEYMAPERFEKGAPADRRSDVFALGVMLWQAAARRRLWDGLSHIEVFQRLSAGEVPTLRSVVPDAPEALAALCDRALAADPADRMPTAAAFAEELDAYLESNRQEVKPRELAAYVAEAFAERRAQTRTAIELALQRTPPSSERSLSGAALSDLPTLTEGSTRDVDALSSPGGAHSSLPSFTGRRGFTLTSTNSGLPPAPTLVSASPEQLAQRRRRPVWPWALGAAGGLVVAGGVGLWPSLRPEAASTASTASSVAQARPPPSAPSSVAAPVPSTPLTRVLVAASPAQAQLFIDEVPLSSNPASAAFMRDGQLHRVRAEAPGYRGEVKLVAYDVQEQVVTLNLQREVSAPSPPPRPRDGGRPQQPAAGATTATAPPPPPPPPAHEPPAPKPPKPPAPKLDRESPW